MMLKQFKPNNILFTSTLILSTLTLLTSSNWIIMWMMLEVNLMSITPMLMNSKKSYEMESSIKYFIIQTVGSSLLLLSVTLLMSSTYFTLALWIFMTSILLKLGSAPCHMWMPPIMSNTNWIMLLILSTWQKISPLWILMNLSYLWSTSALNMIITMNAFIGSVGGLNQTQMRPLLAYSSINHMAWMISSMSLSLYLISIYFLTYSIIISLTILTITKLDTSYTNNFSTMMSTSSKSSSLLFLHLLSLSGLPPLLGFFPKWLILKTLSQYSTFIPLILIISTSLSLFYYLNIYLSSQQFKKTIITNEPPFFMIYFSVLMTVPTPILLLSS